MLKAEMAKELLNVRMVINMCSVTNTLQLEALHPTVRQRHAKDSIWGR